MGYLANLFKCGIEEMRIVDGAVTDTSFPDRRGRKAESRGSALCLIACTYARL